MEKLTCEVQCQSITGGQCLLNLDHRLIFKIILRKKYRTINLEQEYTNVNGIGFLLDTKLWRLLLKWTLLVRWQESRSSQTGLRNRVHGILIRWSMVETRIWFITRILASQHNYEHLIGMMLKKKCFTWAGVNRASPVWWGKVGRHKLLKFDATVVIEGGVAFGPSSRDFWPAFEFNFLLFSPRLLQWTL